MFIGEIPVFLQELLIRSEAISGCKVDEREFSSASWHDARGIPYMPGVNFIAQSLSYRFYIDPY